LVRDESLHIIIEHRRQNVISLDQPQICQQNGYKWDSNLGRTNQRRRA